MILRNYQEFSFKIRRFFFIHEWIVNRYFSDQIFQKKLNSYMDKFKRVHSL